LPASNPAPEDGVLRRVSPDVIPFAGVAAGVGAWIRGVWQHWTGRKVRFSALINVFFFPSPSHENGTKLILFDV
jgi:hypothetical protein